MNSTLHVSGEISFVFFLCHNIYIAEKKILQFQFFSNIVQEKIKTDFIGLHYLCFLNVNTYYKLNTT